MLYSHTTPFPWQSKFTIAHPEYVALDRAQAERHWGVLEYAYPKARAYKVKQLKSFVDDCGFDGVYVCTRSHSPPAGAADQFGFNEPIVDEYRRRYGVDILREDFDKARWRRLRGEYLTQLFRDLRAALPKDKRIFAAIPRGRYIGPPYGNLYLAWETWVKERLVDGLALGVVSGRWLYPRQKRSDQEKGYLSSQEAGIGVQAARDDVAQVYGPLCQKSGVTLLLSHRQYRDADKQMLGWEGLDGLMLHGFSTACLVPSAIVPDGLKLAFADAAFTVDLWVKVRSLRGGPRLVSKYDHQLPDNAGRGWEVMLVDGGHVQLRVNDGQRDWTVTSQTAIAPGPWTHVACVSEGSAGKMRIYIDGKEDPATAPAPGAVRVVPVDLRIGEYGGPSTRQRLEGLIDDLRLTHRALTFDARPTAPSVAAAGTVALWRFDDATEKGFANSTGDSTLNGRFGGHYVDAVVDGQAGFGKALNVAKP